jgi:hypothetical protein
MNQEEVQGLQALAKKHGTSLTINPDTGMPEAFKLGGVFKALIPIAAGAMFPTFGASFFGGMEGIGAGILAGAATAALSGGNPIIGGITGALGGAGGASVGNSFANLGSAGAATGTNVANVTAQNAATNVVGNTLMGQGATAFSSPFTSMFTPSGIAGGAGLGVGTVGNAAIAGQTALANTAGNALTNQAMNASLTGANTAANAGNAINVAGTTQAAAPSYTDKLKSGVEKFFQKETTYIDPVSGKTVTGSGLDAYKASLPTKGGELTGVTKDAAGNVVSSTYNPVKGATNMDVFKKIGTPVGGALLGGVEASDLNPQINLSEQEQKVYEQTGVDSAGKPTFGYIAKSAFNPYRTLNLSGPSPLNLGQSLKLPATTGYAAGGTIATGGIRDLYGSSDSQAQAPLSRDGYGLGRLNQLGNQQSLSQAQTLGYAEGGETSLNLNRLPSLNLGSGRQEYGGGSGDILASMDPNDPMVQQFFRPGIEKMRAQYNALYGDGSDNILNTMGPNDPIMQKFLRPGIEKMRAQNKALYGDGPDSILNTIDRNDPIAQKMLIPGIEKIRAQNKAVFGYVKGGYLDGAGDGMSDSIPATIEGKQPARLADGEFVVPADVVSHLGNGSSKAGSKRLYAMLDKVRKARTGRVKQGRQINPNKYMPA